MLKQREDKWNTKNKKKKKRMRKSKPHLPQDLIFTEILPRLPVKSLLRFKSVCKSWNTLISSTHFANCHLEHTTRSQCHKSVLFTTQEGFITLRYEEIEDVNVRGNYTQHLKFYQCYEFDECGDLVYLVGSCNGLVCVQYSEDEDDEYYFHVLNPATGDYKIKYFGLARINFDDVFFGFGYVASTDDYKIVVVGVFCDSIMVYVYSMRLRGDWTEIEMGYNELNLAPNWFGGPGILLNETLHWGTTDGRILGFDLVEEKFKIEFQVPPVLKGMPSRSLHPGFNLTVIKGCLCAWGEHNNGLAEVWMMKEYGVWDSWTKLFDCNIKSASDGEKNTFEQILDVLDSKFLMRTEAGSLVVTDWRRRRRTYVHVADTLDAVKHVESLILPLSMRSE